MKVIRSFASTKNIILQSVFLLLAVLTSSTVSAETYQLVYSLTSDRAGQITLEGATVSSNIYGRMLPETGGIQRVRYFLDGSATEFKTEFSAPYDLQGGPASSALPYDTALLNDGTHTINTEVLLTTGAIVNFDTSFVVDNNNSGGSGGTERVSASINDGKDDVEEKEKKGTVYFDSTDLELIHDSYDKQNKQTVGLRFNGIDIPQGATITNAYLEFTVDETGSKSIGLTISGQAADNAPAFSSTINNVSSRSRTSAKVEWTPDNWSTIGDKKQTPDLTSVVQEIVNRSGWKANNSMAFLITGDNKDSRVAESYEGSVSGAPKLVIDYETTGGSINHTPTLNPVSDQIIQAGSNQTVSFSASDEDGDALSYSISGIPGFGTFTDNGDGTASLQLAPATSDIGNYNVSVTVSDAELSAIRSFQITVIETDPPVSVNVLPVIELTADSIVDEPKSPGTFHLTSEAFSQDTGVLNMGIEFRGSTSQEFDKKSFGIELVKASDPTDELNLALLDLRKDGDWILDASYRDTSFVRNIIGHDIWNDLHPYAFIDENGVQTGQATIRGHLTEVYLNNEYHGVYVLEEKVDRKLLDLKKIDVPVDENGNELFDQIDFSDPQNGSVIYKADSNFATLDFVDTARVDFEQEYPDIDDVARWEPLEELISFIADSSNANFIANIGNIVDIDSVVDYWIWVNVIGDTDSLKKNYFLARSGAGKFFFVPWDNDASFSMWWDGSRVDWTFAYWDTDENALIRRLTSLTQTGFNTRVKQRWNELRNTLLTHQALTARFQEYHALLDNQNENGESARDRNLARWPDSGNLGSNNPELGTADFISGWIGDRLDFLDVQINNMPE